MADRSWITELIPTPLIFRYHLPLKQTSSYHTVQDLKKLNHFYLNTLQEEECKKHYNVAQQYTLQNVHTLVHIVHLYG
jgi:hypothetical protein